jgi:hypothetical protein
MIKPFPLNDLQNKIELVPQAILLRSIWEIAKKLDFKVEKGQDDFDSYEGFGAYYGDLNLIFAVMHYRGYPKETSTIYLPRDVKQVEKITETIHLLVKEMYVSENEIEWERAHDPTL